MAVMETSNAICAVNSARLSKTAATVGDAGPGKSPERAAGLGTGQRRIRDTVSLCAG